MATPYMNLSLPVVSETLGPEWAASLNAALEVVDSHNHASGNGVRIPTSGLNINANLSANEWKIYDLLSTQFDSQSATLTGASNANSVYVVSGNLYYTNGSGTAVQITAGGAVATTPGEVQSLEYTTLSSNLTIDPSDEFVFISVDTTSSRTIDLPIASAVTDGRVYVIKDATGNSNANPITVDCQGSDLIDGASSFVIQSNYAAYWFIGDGVSNWRSF